MVSSGFATETGDDDLEDGNRGAFGQLVLPPGHKRMVLSLISQHFRSKQSQNSTDEQVDIVRGKGTTYIQRLPYLFRDSVEETCS